MLYLAIDQHRKQLTVNLRNEQGVVILKRQVSTQWPRVRKPVVVMTLAVAATAAAAVFPWRALLVVQAALPGVLLTVLAAGLRLALRPTSEQIGAAA